MRHVRLAAIAATLLAMLPATAAAATRYRFRVTVADADGNRSDAATIRLRIVRG